MLRIIVVCLLAAPAVTVTPGAHSSAACPLRLPEALLAGTVSVPILMYHRIDVVDASTPAITRRLTVDPEDFAAQCVGSSATVTARSRSGSSSLDSCAAESYRASR